ncbi:hypothetical protein K490DRAFT_63144 [Saccharata proteae CBS 121410]|uniref:Uncharacterized protein n=1 Tax=Saccharata proteae CBS 121410 TaxID=1314787 RepID=A0A9P4LYF5_9PEZI|nr:hypothetical protein K490DRAFT_63144 [Saccharata proteae CBS 121410]
MLPPVEPATLGQNPKFKALYQDLSKEKLNGDASTKDVKRERAQEQQRKQLQARRTNDVKIELVKKSLESLRRGAPQLPDELLEVIAIVCAQVTGRIPLSDLEFVEGDLEYFIENIDPVAAAASEYLITTARYLVRIANPEQDDLASSAMKSQIARLPVIAARKAEAVRETTEALAAKRVELADVAAEVLAAHARLTEVVVQILEQTVHGSVSRAQKAKAEHLAAVAEGMGKKLSIIHRSYQPPADVLDALRDYTKHLDSETAELEHRRAIAEDRLRDFEAAGKGMGEIANRYAEVNEEILEVRRELERLGE